jgi:hypothetical protein
MRLSAAATLLAAACWLGCNRPPSGPPPDVLPAGVHEVGEGHDHGHHHHGHAHLGPNGGHLVEFQTEEYHAEWLHDDESGKLTVFILDGAAKEAVPIAADEITIEKKIGDKVSTHQLAAAGRTTESQQSARFEVVDKPLIEALKTAGKGVEATLTVEIDGRKFTGKFEHDDHGHGHAH